MYLEQPLFEGNLVSCSKEESLPVGCAGMVGCEMSIKVPSSTAGPFEVYIGGSMEYEYTPPPSITDERSAFHVAGCFGAGIRIVMGEIISIDLAGDQICVGGGRIGCWMSVLNLYGDTYVKPYGTEAILSAAADNYRAVFAAYPDVYRGWRVVCAADVAAGDLPLELDLPGLCEVRNPVIAREFPEWNEITLFTFSYSRGIGPKVSAPAGVEPRNRP